MQLAEEISRWIKQQVEAAGKQGVVVGLSGGIDSAVSAALAVKGLGKDKVIALFLPCESQGEDLVDAKAVQEKLKIKAYTCGLTEAFQVLQKLLPSASREIYGNLKPRLRMAVLYYYAALHNSLVLGTGNKSELSLGYFTKYGDGGVDLLPLGNLYKYEVVTLARQLGIPRSVIEKPPTAGLYQGQTDEGEIGLSYNEIDHILECLERGEVVENSKEKIERIELLVKQAAHKQQIPPIFRQKKEREEGESIVCHELKIIPGSYLVLRKGEPVELTFKEFELLKFLATHPGKVFTREQLLAEVWGKDFLGGVRTVDVHIRRLRAKLETEGQIYIETIRSVGYTFKRWQ